VIAIEHRIISTGYNGVPAGLPHCDHTCNCNGKWPEKPDNMTDSGPVFHSDVCARVAPCRVTVHAESNAVAFAARYGTPTQDATIYTTLSPCYDCAKLIINAGLVRCVYGTAYRDWSGVELMMQAGIQITDVEHRQAFNLP
jgi:dCMP deaminase